MKCGILEIDELTLRQLEQLPFAEIDEAPADRLIVCQIRGFIDHPLFDVIYSAIIYLGDFGIYRVTDIHNWLTPSLHGRMQ